MKLHTGLLQHEWPKVDFQELGVWTVRPVGAVLNQLRALIPDDQGIYRLTDSQQWNALNNYRDRRVT